MTHRAVRCAVRCAVVLALAACGEDAPRGHESQTEIVEATEATEVEAEQATETEQVDDDPLAGLDDLDALEAEAPATALPIASIATIDASLPERGCVAFGEHPTKIWARPGPANVAAVGEDGFVVAGYSAQAGEGEQVWAVSIEPGRPPRPLMAEALEHALSVRRTAPPGLGRLDDGHAGIATIDGSSNVRFAVMHLGGRRNAWRDVGTSGDQRFAPAVGTAGTRHVVAYTDGGETPMRVRYIAYDALGNVHARHNLSTDGMGSAGAVFVRGEEAIAFVDPHEATTPSLIATLGESAPATHVLLPLTNVYEPAALAVAKIGSHRLLAYTAVGNAAATAVGLVAIREQDSHGPIALVPSTGYGMLHVDVAVGPRRAVFVADRPKARERGAPREVVVIVAEPTDDGTTLGEPLVLQTPDETARWAHIARHSSGTYAVALTGGDGVYVHFLRCAEGD